MEDAPTTPAEPVAEAPPAEPTERTVPYDRFAEVNSKAREAQEQAKKLEQRLAELEDRDKTEAERSRAQLEREQRERERLAAELQQRDQRLTELERGSWVRAAAAQAKFIDPEDAVVNVNLAQIEDEKDAERAVKKLAERKKHLVNQEPERPEIGQVLQSGRPTDPATAQAVQAAQQRQEGEAFVEELRAAVTQGRTSIPGLLEG